MTDISQTALSDAFLWQAIIWTNADPIHWSIYAALEGDQLMHNIVPGTKREWQDMSTSHNY